MIKLTDILNELEINNPNKIPLYFINDDYVYVLLDNKYKYKGYVDEGCVYFNLNSGLQPYEYAAELLKYLSKFKIDVDGYDINQEAIGIEIPLDKVNIKNIND